MEFALAITVFLLLMMAIVDFGRGIYMYNGVSQAAGRSPGRPACIPVLRSARALTPPTPWRCSAGSSRSRGSDLLVHQHRDVRGREPGMCAG